MPVISAIGSMWCVNYGIRLSKGILLWHACYFQSFAASETFSPLFVHHGPGRATLQTRKYCKCSAPSNVYQCVHLLSLEQLHPHLGMLCLWVTKSGVVAIGLLTLKVGGSLAKPSLGKTVLCTSVGY